MSIIFMDYGVVGTSNWERSYASPGAEWIVAWGPRPTTSHVLNQYGHWEIPVTRDGLLEQINAKKNQMRDGGFEVLGVHWDSDSGARIAYNEVALKFLVDPTFSVDWKASDGAWVRLDKALFDEVTAVGTAHIEAAFAWQKAKEEELANTPDEDLNKFEI